MDTKSKNIKYSLPVKALCLLFSAAFIAVSSYSMLGAAARALIEGRLDSYGKDKIVYTESGYYQDVFSEAVTNASALLSFTSTDEMKKELADRKDEIVPEAVDDYREAVVSIIRSELEYVVETEDYGYIEVTAPVLEGSESATTVDPQRKLYVSGYEEASAALALPDDEIIKCRYLVRDEAFHQHFDTSIETGRGSVQFCLGSCDKDPEEVELDFQVQYDNYVKNVVFDESEIIWASEGLEKAEGILYYASAENGSRVFTNTDAKTIAEELKTSPLWYCCKNGKASVKMPEAFTKASSIYDNYVACRIANTDEPLTEKDKGQILIVCLPASEAKRLNSGPASTFLSSGRVGTDFTRDLVNSVSFFIAAAVLLFILLRLCGHRAGQTEPVLAPVDKVPTDVHFVVSLALTFGLLLLTAIAGVVFIFGERYVDGLPGTDRFRFTPLAAGVCCTALVLNWFVFAEWLGSTVRIKKAGLSFFSKCGLFRLLKLLFVQLFRSIKWVCRLIKKLFTRIFKALSLLTYKPGNFRRSTMIMLAGVILAAAVLVGALILFAEIGDEGAAVIALLLLGALLVFVCIRLLSYAKSLDNVISVASGAEPAVHEPEKLPSSLRTLSDSLDVTREKMNEAVYAALRDERMKTELITNVSHDLKTPLTSIINYVDLLKKTNIEDETAKGYLEVLDEKSKRLKSLVEDLVEASKASSGAVTLNLTSIDLKELLMQLLGEMSEDFEAQLLDTVFACPEQPPVVVADSQKTYRVMENLLTNAKKYSAPGTRIYITLSEAEGFGRVEVKNISRDPLNISADELMERFVRGDVSRTDGGNGLGLSIARDLCALQGGSLEISVDGDLFKAAVNLPLR